jgi:hypothetical protein
MRIRCPGSHEALYSPGVACGSLPTDGHARETTMRWSAMELDGEVATGTGACSLLLCGVLMRGVQVGASALCDLCVVLGCSPCCDRLTLLASAAAPACHSRVAVDTVVCM